MFFAGPKKYSVYSDTAASTSKDHSSASRAARRKARGGTKYYVYLYLTLGVIQFRWAN